MDFPDGLDSKASAYNAGDPGSIPGQGRSPGEGNSNPLQYSCLGNPMDREASQATVHGVAKSRNDLLYDLAISYCYGGVNNLSNISYPSWKSEVH